MDVTRILILEDVETDAELILRALKQGSLLCEAQRVETRSEYETALQVFQPDLIISDFSLPAFDGMSALRIANASYPETPFIFVSGTIGEETAVESLKQGATDYLVKGNLARLGPAVRRALREREERHAVRSAEAALRMSEAKFRAVVESVSEWIWEVDSDWQLTFSNGACVTMLGRNRASILGTDVRELLHPEDLSATQITVADASTTFWAAQTLRWRHADGSYRWLECNARALRDTAGSDVGYRGSNRDVTERTRQAERIARLSRIQAVSSGINSAIVRIRDRPQLFRDSCRIMIEQGEFIAAWIGLLDPVTREIRTTTHVGFDPGLLARMEISSDDCTALTRDLIAPALRELRPVVANDLQTDGRAALRAELESMGCRSAAVLPLLVDGTAVGVLALCAVEAGAFTGQEMQLLDALAGDISFALDYLTKAEQLEYLAYYDALTELPNRNLLHDRLSQAIAQADRYGRLLAVLFVDLDRFKLINEALGHKVGDAALKAVAARLKAGLREGDTIARLSGDEFALVLSGHESEASIHRVMIRTLSAIAAPIRVDDHELVISCSIGCSVHPRDGNTAELLLRSADAAMHNAKATGGGESRFYVQEMNLRLDERMSMEQALRAALDRKELFVEYQPQATLPGGEVVGCEALLRWQHPEKGLVPPMRFIPLAEETGLIMPIGEWVLRTACLQNKAWIDAGLGPIRVSVNLSALQFRQKNLLAQIREILATTELPPEYLELEITEGMLIHDAEAVIAMLRELHEMGVKLALDDFGTGYSSLSYLKRFRVDRLKIDRSFVRDITVDPDDAAISAAVISLGHALNIAVIAEGVETHEQSAYLQGLGCDEVQGYLYGKPMSVKDFEVVLARGVVTGEA